MFGDTAEATPPPPALPDPLASPPSFASGGTKPAGNTNKIPSYGGTLLTSGEGVTAPSPTTKKSLLGQ